MAVNNAIPSEVANSIIHVRTEENKEEVVFPITSYENILNAPRVVTHKDALTSPISLLTVFTEEVDESTLAGYTNLQHYKV